MINVCLLHGCSGIGIIKSYKVCRVCKVERVLQTVLNLFLQILQNGSRFVNFVNFDTLLSSDEFMKKPIGQSILSSFHLYEEPFFVQASEDGAQRALCDLHSQLSGLS